ncbi:ABC transporter ATP-binding protein [Mycoplasmopsis columbinasalis]|uniref:ABC-type multidrug/protein/lipid transport system ATPase component n=1 Tax=Mycoplasmopsis columbinasalis TaxID=114880 RepID=A0A449BAT4_9BACT|nr:ABC transporter ATP-binding protein [Mycoplasmopsis columbinasalis]VEU78315.1 ABC-type multidrug/protein/lipid transport system ATPase component [Mycoplasmopsis columbinasalis]
MAKNLNSTTRDKQTKSKQQKMSTWQLLKRFFSFLEKKDQRMVIVGIFVALLSSACLIIATLLTGLVITKSLTPAIVGLEAFNVTRFAIYIAVMGVLFLSYAVAGYFQNRIFINISYKAATQMRKVAMDKLLFMPTAFYDKEMAGDLIQSLVTDISNVSNTVTKLVSQVFANLFSIIFGLFSLFFISSILALIIMVSLVSFLAVTILMIRKARPAMIATQAAFGEINAYVEEMLRNTKITQTLDNQAQAQSDFNTIAHKIYKHSFVGDFYQRIFDPWFIFASNITVIIAIILALVFKLGGVPTFGLLYKEADAGFVVALISQVFTINGTIQQVMLLFLTVQLGHASSQRVFRITDLIPPDSNQPTVPLPAGTKGEIRFQNVFFKYNENSPTYQLNDATFYAKPGQTIAIVGPTGAGKTTIISLLSKFYYYNQGSITLDGIELNQIDKHDLRDIMAVVLQDSFMFNDTILNNLKIAKPEATLEEVREVTRLVSADDFILKLKNGYDTVLENNGANLSQGERQLLAIARAVLGDKKILILDEATSNVDSNTEKIIQTALQDTIMKNKTSIVIAHRLSTIKNADLILVVEGGRIIEKGNHQELMARQGYYWNLYQTQFN